MKSVNHLDYIVVGVYFLLMLGIGIAFARYNKSGREYFTGGSLIPWWVSGMTMYMANFSAWTFTGAAGFVYSTGWFAIVYFAIWPLAYFGGTLLTAVRWRRTRSVSPVEYTRARFNDATRQLFGWIIASNFILTAGVQLAALSRLIAPLLNIDLTMLTVVIGLVIVAYTFFGGVWAVSVTDVVQGIILIAVTFVIAPLAIGLAGGLDTVITSTPPLSTEHTYNGFHYTADWLVSIFLIMTLGVAAGQAQRFYSVKTERDALKTGMFAGVLFFSVALVFGLPPLAAAVLWPDLQAEPFFQTFGGKSPQDLVFVAFCLKLLPNGLIGFFISAMLAATMSTLSSVYNMVSSILAKDVYQGVFRPQATERDLLRVGRLSTVGLGIVVVLLALYYNGSSLGIFNIMQVFYTLVNLPIVVPIAAGLLFRKSSAWAAAVAVVGGLLVGVLTRYLLYWEIGWQVYAQCLVTTALFLGSNPLARLYRRSKSTVAVLSILCTAMVLFIVMLQPHSDPLMTGLRVAIAIVLGAGVYPASRLFSRETSEKRAEVEVFFQRLNTPIDVAAEIDATAVKAPSVGRIAGLIAAGLGAACLLFLPTTAPEETGVVFALAGILVGVGALLWAMDVVRIRSEQRRNLVR